MAYSFSSEHSFFCVFFSFLDFFNSSLVCSLSLFPFSFYLLFSFSILSHVSFAVSLFSCMVSYLLLCLTFHGLPETFVEVQSFKLLAQRQTDVLKWPTVSPSALTSLIRYRADPTAANAFIII